MPIKNLLIKFFMLETRFKIASNTRYELLTTLLKVLYWRQLVVLNVYSDMSTCVKAIDY